MNDVACPESLAIAARRGALSEADAIVWAKHLSACATCRMSERLATDFAAELPAAPDDADRIAFAVDRVMRARSRRPATWSARPMRVLALAAGVLFLVVGVASAGYYAVRATRSKPEPLTVPEAQPAAHHRAKVVAADPVPDPLPEADLPTQDMPAEAQPSMVIVPHVRSSVANKPKSVVHPSEVVPPKSAPAIGKEALFSQANDARRTGDLPTAVHLYEELQQRFAGSREARLSHISLGRVLLDGGKPAQALAQFDGYLSNGKEDVLSAEALYGRGRSLGALGRRDEARATWQTLKDRYPASAYADMATKYLGDGR